MATWFDLPSEVRTQILDCLFSGKSVRLSTRSNSKTLSRLLAILVVSKQFMNRHEVASVLFQVAVIELKGHSDLASLSQRVSEHHLASIQHLEVASEPTLSLREMQSHRLRELFTRLHQLRRVTVIAQGQAVLHVGSCDGWLCTTSQSDLCSCSAFRGLQESHFHGRIDPSPCTILVERALEMGCFRLQGEMTEKVRIWEQILLEAAQTNGFETVIKLACAMCAEDELYTTLVALERRTDVSIFSTN